MFSLLKYIIILGKLFWFEFGNGLFFLVDLKNKGSIT